MTISEIAEKVVAYNREHKYKEIYAEFYSPEVVSVEAVQGPLQEVRGMEGLMKKMEWWESNNEVHGIEVSEPLIADDHFAVVFTMDVTFKQTNTRSKSSELAVYEVKDGKIVREQFFYRMDV
jgi:hypothetical protein